MKTILYYFTGTGNSLSTAKLLAKSLPDTELLPVAGLLSAGKKITVPTGCTAGFVFPMYCGGMPNIMKRFFEAADLSKADYVFSVINPGSSAQGSPVKHIAEYCEAAGHTLNGSWWVQMPDNYIPLANPPEKAGQEKMFAAAEEKIAVISDAVLKKETVLEPWTFLGKLMFAAAYKTFSRKLTVFDKKFRVSPHCCGCQTCVKVCPVNNITFEAIPVWHHHCEGCLACLQFCPKGAISCGGKTEERIRYHHPAANVSDMIAQKQVKEDSKK
ncbi:MAG TPA: EFR1 family ferrodoxin [Methanocorpusculum sp.]|nr:EFR1 family ferrodoxin [Methanocorpusculum sp.]